MRTCLHQRTYRCQCVYNREHIKFDNRSKGHTPCGESRLFQRFWDIFGAASVRVKVLGIVLGVIVLLGLFVMVQMRQALYDTLETALQAQGIDLAHFVGGRVDDALLCCEPDMAADVLDGLQEHYSGNGHNTLVDYMFVTDPDGELRAASDADAITPEMIRRPPRSQRHRCGISLPRRAM